jgi:CMP-2-keto-3-deoxyoctulosonic acid synthetase
MKRFAMLAVVASLAIGCEKHPCTAFEVMAAHRAELQQCDRLTQYREDMLECVADVEARYAAKFAELSVDVIEDIERIRRELAEGNR